MFTFPRLASVALTGAFALSIFLTAAVFAQPSPANSAHSGPKPTIVLVHGAFADASSWTGVVKRLQDEGYPVLAPANPLRGVSSDAAYIASVLDSVSGPVVLVGHSYGGAVITNAAVGHASVKALVYIAAYIPDLGQSLSQLAPAAGGSELVPPGVPGVTPTLIVRPCPPASCAPAFGGNFDAYIDPADFHEIFAADLPSERTAIMAVEQRPLAVSALFDQSGPPAWSTIPSFALVPNQDRAIGTANELAMAQHAHARVVRVDGSHAVLSSHPEAVVRLIDIAAQKAQ